MTYAAITKTATGGAEPGGCSEWGELQDDAASRTDAR
jgi:hypothetical protein